MPQMKSALAKVRTDIEDFKDGLRRGAVTGMNASGEALSTEIATKTSAPSPTHGRGKDRFFGVLVDLLKVLLFGFIVAGPGVPLLPWGEPAGIAMTLVGVVLLGLTNPGPNDNPPAEKLDGPRPRRAWLELALFAAALACATLASNAVPASLMAGGAVMALLMRLARLRGYVYALVAGVLAARLLLSVLDMTLYSGPQWVLSGETFSPDEAARQATLVAAVFFLNAMQQFAMWSSRTQRLRAEEAERARDDAAANERARIARELHDVVSHHVTAMTLQAEAAVATGDRAVLESLANSGREAAAELRRMLGVLRHPAEESPTQPPDPQPRLADLDGLARRLSGGVEVTVERTGQPRPLPAGVELCAYRVIQEALTNVAKHSDAHQASVAIDYAPRRLKIEVVDDGQPVQRVREPGGHGLIGMRERVSLLDGELEVGPRQEQPGYRVFASIPL